MCSNTVAYFLIVNFICRSVYFLNFQLTLQRFNKNSTRSLVTAMDSLKTAALWYHHHHHHRGSGDDDDDDDDDDSRGTQKNSRHERLDESHVILLSEIFSHCHIVHLTVLTALEFQPSFSDENQMTNGKF